MRRNAEIEIAVEIPSIDIRGGKLTYGQRIELGQILFDEKKSASQKYAAAMACLYPGWTQTFAAEWIARYQEVIEGIEYWMKKEAAMLDYQPTGDELAAGFNDLGRKLGPMMTVMTLAEKFSRDPDEILQWEYGKVFGLLYADLENFKFQRRYRRIMEKKEQARRLARK